MAGWQQIYVNGVQADALVLQFPTAPTFDARLVIDGLTYQAAAAGAVRIFLAPGMGAAEENRVDIVNSANFTPPDALQRGNFACQSVPIITTTRTPLGLRINKGDAGNGSLWISWYFKPGPGC